MTSLSGGNGDLVEKLAAFFDMGGILLFHTYRAAASADVAGETQQLLHRHHGNLLISGSFCSLLEIQLAAYGDAEYMNAGVQPAS